MYESYFCGVSNKLYTVSAHIEQAVNGFRSDVSLPKVNALKTYQMWFDSNSPSNPCMIFFFNINALH